MKTWFLKTTDGREQKFSSQEDLQETILDLFSEEGMNPIEDVWTEENGKRTQLVTEWSVTVRPMREG